MSKAHLLFPLIGAAVTLFGVIKNNAPPTVLDRLSDIDILEGYDDYPCSFSMPPHTMNSTCLSGVNPDYDTIQAVEDFYLGQLKSSAWIHIPTTLYETPSPKSETAYFVKDKSTSCQIEIAITVSQNTYRGGVKLDDISVRFEEYLVNCPVLDLSSP